MVFKRTNAIGNIRMKGREAVQEEKAAGPETVGDGGRALANTAPNPDAPRWCHAFLIQ